MRLYKSYVKTIIPNTKNMKNLIAFILLFFIVFFAGCEKEGLDGKSYLVKIDNEPIGDNCTSGGYKIMSGLDINENNVLDGDEVQTTNYLCHGNDGLFGPEGLKSLIRADEESKSDNCKEGGYRISTGIDFNDNDTLDEEEIQSTQFICHGSNGVDGSDGTNGLNSIIRIDVEPRGDNCVEGGYRVNSGIDINRNNLLDDNEVDQISYICNGFSSNEIRLDFLHSNDLIVSSDNSGYIGGAFIPKFNINNYQGVDSIIFGAYLDSKDASTTCLLELYDQTNSLTINGSQISSNSQEFELVTSTGNLLNEFPDETIDLTIKIRTTVNGNYARCHSVFLILYRH